MKILCLIILLMVFVGCKNEMANKNTTKKEVEKTKRIDDIDGSLENVEYLAFNGVNYDTIYLDSLNNQIGIHNYKIIDGQVYFAYSIKSTGKTARNKPYESCEGLFINSCDTTDLPLKTGKWLDMDEINLKDSLIYIGGYNRIDAELDFERSFIMPDSDSVIYLYIKLPEASNFRAHILIEKIDNYFEKRFEISTTDYNLSFDIENDSLLTCKYYMFLEDTTLTNEFKYDIKNKTEIK